MKDKFAKTIKEYPENDFLDFAVIDRALSQYRQDKWKFFGLYVFLTFVSFTFVIELLSNFLSRNIFGVLSSKYSLLIETLQSFMSYVSKFGGFIVIAFIFMVVFECRATLPRSPKLFIRN